MTSPDDTDTLAAIAAGTACLRAIAAHANARGLSGKDTARLVLFAAVTALSKAMVVVGADKRCGGGDRARHAAGRDGRRAQGPGRGARWGGGVTTRAPKVGKVRRPCANCPWRVDAPREHWDPQHFRDIWSNCQGDSMNAMACHKSAALPKGSPVLPCQGWARVIGRAAIGVRLALMKGSLTAEEVADRGGPRLFRTFAAMMRANKVEPPPDRNAEKLRAMREWLGLDDHPAAEARRRGQEE